VLLLLGMARETGGPHRADRHTAFAVVTSGRCTARRMHLAHMRGAGGRVTTRAGGLRCVVIGVTGPAIAGHLLLPAGGVTGAALEARVPRVGKREWPGCRLWKDRQREKRRQLLRSA
jgi:hypothetical protein